MPFSIKFERTALFLLLALLPPFFFPLFHPPASAIPPQTQ